MHNRNRHFLRRAALAGAAFLPVLLFAGLAAAQVEGQPAPGGIGLPATVTEVGRETQQFYNVVLLPVISFIALSVLGLLIYVAWRFNEHANPVPSKLTHHTGLEIAWTLVPVLILVFHRHSLVPLVGASGGDSAGESHHQGDRQSMVLVL